MSRERREIAAMSYDQVYYWVEVMQANWIDWTKWPHIEKEIYAIDVAHNHNYLMILIHRIYENPSEDTREKILDIFSKYFDWLKELDSLLSMGFMIFKRLLLDILREFSEFLWEITQPSERAYMVKYEVKKEILKFFEQSDYNMRLLLQSEEERIHSDEVFHTNIYDCSHIKPNVNPNLKWKPIKLNGPLIKPLEYNLKMVIEQSYRFRDGEYRDLWLRSKPLPFHNFVSKNPNVCPILSPVCEVRMGGPIVYYENGSIFDIHNDDTAEMEDPNKFDDLEE